jgi:hypothetical protein
MPGRNLSPNRRDRLMRRLLPLVVATVLLVALVVWVAVPGGSRTATVVTSATSTTVASSAVASTATTVPPTTTTTTDAGALPQTGAFPSSASPQFLAAMQALFTSIVAGTPATASGAFFPQGAYMQLKDIGGALYDYQHRLLGDFGDDVMAAHAELGAGAAGADLTSVQVPMQYAHWVPAGECENGVGYFEVANSRLVYTEDGVTRSFGIASLISWRGEWYLVHLGAILRPGGGGVVLDPEAGAGTSAPSTTC